MKNTHIILFISILVSIFFGSCNKNESITPNNLKINTKSVFSENGRLIFKDSIVFLEHLKWVQENQNMPEVIEKFNKILGIKSLNSVYIKGVNLNDSLEFLNYKEKHPLAFYTSKQDSSEFIELPCPNIISLIANENGIYQVGKSISKVVPNNLIVQKYENENKVKILAKLTLKSNNLKSLLSTYGSGLTVSQKYYRTAYRTGYKIKGRLVAKCNHYSYGSGLELYDAISVSQRHFWYGWTQNNLAGSVGISYVGQMDILNRNSTESYIPIYGEDSNYGSRQSLTVFLYNRFYQHIDLTNSICKITHTGADKTIVVYLF